jgi:hypothetical protein
MYLIYYYVWQEEKDGFFHKYSYGNVGIKYWFMYRIANVFLKVSVKENKK